MRHTNYGKEEKTGPACLVEILA